MRRIINLVLLVTIFSGCSEEKEKLMFTSVPASVSKLYFSNKLTQNNALNILDYLYYYNGGGVALGDINNDGLEDIYFTANQVSNKLFLNKGNMQFEDITEMAGVAGKSDWNTGVVMADVNGDNYLDIYVTAVVGINGLRGRNELFINNGDNTFTETAEAYNLDFSNYSSNSAFFDYDNDGDLDMYLLNHAVHTVNSYGPAEIRNTRKEESGDKLLRNDNGFFTDVSEEAGIYGGANSYGLGLATADFNNDGFTDIYVSNDFHEDDYYYINNGDGTFSEKLKEKFGHVSRFSMGSDVADVNADGYMDILTLDMLPQEEKVLKSSMGDDPFDLHNMKIERLNYHHQYTRNMLQVNRDGIYFQETGLLSGLAATDWSWSALFADYDQDGTQDVFIATGIPKRPNDLDYIKYVSSEQIRTKITTTKLVDQKALDKMPSGAVHNYLLRGGKDLRFIDKSGEWISRDSIISTGAAYADLDNDGDLDIVTNNINHPATLYRNDLNNFSSYLKLRFDHPAPNTFGIGTKVFTYSNGDKQQARQLYTSRGFQSSSSPLLHFGFEEGQKADSLLIIWPDNTFQVERNIPLNETLVIKPNPGAQKVDFQSLFPKRKNWFQKIDAVEGMDFVHEENSYVDFNRQKLIPYRISDRGPAVAVKDLNGDGKEDIFFGNSKWKSARVYLQTRNGFKEQEFSTLKNDSISEDVAVIIEDFNSDSKNDIFVVSSGGEFSGESEALLDRLYISGNGDFKKRALPSYFENGSVVRAADYDKDGEKDIFVGSGAVSNDFGNIPNSYLLKNNGDNFSIIENLALQKAGMVTDAVWTDFDNDGWEDLIVVGEWMAPQFFRNDEGSLKKVTSEVISEKLKGLWQSIIPFDINKDGKMDYLVGNWGTNTKFTASEEYPLKMYYSDFDKNGSTETILAYAKNGKYYPVLGLDELSSQLSFLRKKFPSYTEFAGKTIQEIFDEQQIKNSKVLEISTLSSGYLLNQDGKFKFKAFKTPLQVAPITSFLRADFNGDSQEEVMAAGNYFGVTPYHGRFDGLAGNIITADGNIMEGSELGINFTQKAVRHLDIINMRDSRYLMVTFNNRKPEFYKILKE